MEPGTAVFDAIVHHFGPSVVLPDGHLNRPALARIAFAQGHVEELNAIVHPATIALQGKLAEEIFAHDPHAIIVVESALIFETRHSEGWRDRFDHMVLVAAPDTLKIDRFVTRSGPGDPITLRAEARRRLAQMIPDEAKARQCDFILHNDGTLAHLTTQVDALWQSLSNSPPNPPSLRLTLMPFALILCLVSVTLTEMTPAQTLAIALPDILAARERLRGQVYQTPCARSETLSRLTGQQVYLKLENLQMTGSFKERGALNRLSLLTPEEAARGVVAASAGNHAQGVAYHATKRGVRSVIVMPLATPLVKVTATREFGAEVILHGANYDEACAEATRLCHAEGMVFLHPFDDAAVMAGQGTIALEMMEQIPALEALIVPIGGGGLIAGMACAAKESNPNLRIIGVQTSRLPSMLRAIESSGPITIEANNTIADGIAVRRAGDLTYPLVQKYVDEIVTVDEDEIASAILILLEREKTLAEGAGAAALAALLQGKTSLSLRSGVPPASSSVAATSTSPSSPASLSEAWSRTAV